MFAVTFLSFVINCKINNALEFKSFFSNSQSLGESGVPDGFLVLEFFGRPRVLNSTSANSISFISITSDFFSIPIETAVESENNIAKNIYLIILKLQK